MPNGSIVEAYHLFRKFGECFVYFLSANRFFHIDPVTYDLLAECRGASLEEAVRSLQSREDYTPEEVEEVAGEVRSLAKAGFLDIPELRVDPEGLERELDARYTAPWMRLKLALAEDCNLACTYCYCDGTPTGGQPALMPIDTVRKAVDWLLDAAQDAPTIYLTLFGGEPLLNREGFQFVVDYALERAAERGKTVRFTLTTNGTLLDDMSIDRIKKHNFGLMVSLDGPQEVHDRQCPRRDGGGSYEAATDGIRRLMERRRRVTVRCTITKKSPRVMELIAFFKEFGFTRFAFSLAQNPANPSPMDCDRDEFEDIGRQEEEELLPWILSEFDKGRIPEYMPYGRFLRDHARGMAAPEGPSVIRCGACRGTTTVGTDGALYPCHRFVGMRAFQMGDIDSGPDIERAKQFWRDYNRAIDDTCSSCWARFSCKGPCPWMIARNDGTFGPCTEWRCDFIRGSAERSAWVLWHVQTHHPEILAQLVGYNEADREREEDDIVAEGQRRGECQSSHGEYDAGVAAVGDPTGGMPI